jgi:hypothetical protein
LRRTLVLQKPGGAIAGRYFDAESWQGTNLSFFLSIFPEI